MGFFNTLIGKVSRAHGAEVADITTLDPAVARLDMIVGARTEILSAVSTRLMCVDVDNVIASINPAATAMFRDAQAELRSVLPGFAVETLAGSSLAKLFGNA